MLRSQGLKIYAPQAYDAVMLGAQRRNAPHLRGKGAGVHSQRPSNFSCGARQQYAQSVMTHYWLWVRPGPGAGSHVLGAPRRNGESTRDRA
jgi:hypothetical protein